ncbi:hypothetical protein GDO86_014488 [Hymenochirus boettgeri]|uniref:Solute carrier family 2, facilitated glucose transporter member 10 n=1 Tax=Hymenochirus boettgeri TaxID=247094 RepID=A0A8T2JUU3_9PIPI|nr:hypothetical protein GDO86_014488 [Hymenochirus boettgeri]
MENRGMEYRGNGGGWSTGMMEFREDGGEWSTGGMEYRWVEYRGMEYCTGMMEYRSTTIVLSVTVSSLGGLIYGYELGIISGALLQVKTAYHLTCTEQEILVSAILIGALFASLIGGVIIDHSGRKISILASNLLVLAGSIILITGISFWLLVIGRITIGFAISISSIACCIYVSEIVPPYRRGLLVSLYETGIAFGVLISYATNYFLSDLSEGWKYMFGLAIIPAVIQFISILFLPSKPHHLNFYEQETESGIIEMEDVSEVGRFKPESCGRNYKFIDLFRSKDNMRMRTLAGLGLVLFQQLTGQPNVLYYASTVFHSVGFQSDSSAMLASVNLGVVKVASTIVAICLADKAGRRILLLAGCVGMAISVTGIGLASFYIKLDIHRGCEHVESKNLSNRNSNNSAIVGQFKDIILITEPQNNSDHRVDTDFRSPIFTKDEEKKLTGLNSRYLNKKHGGLMTTPSSSPVPMNYSVLNLITLISMMAFVSAFSIGFGPMSWLVLSEIYPEEIRGRAFAFCTSFNWGTNLLITFTFLHVIDSIGLPWTFLLYGLIALVATVFVYFFIPETKGKTLEQIDEEFSEKRFSTTSMFNRRRKKNSTGHQYHRLRNLNASILSDN